MFDFHSNKSKLNLNAPSYVPKNIKTFDIVPQFIFNNDISHPLNFLGTNPFNKGNVSLTSSTSSPKSINNIFTPIQNLQSFPPALSLFDRDPPKPTEQEIYEIASKKNYFN
jgi:hypothetical protein